MLGQFANGTNTILALLAVVIPGTVLPDSQATDMSLQSSGTIVFDGANCMKTIDGSGDRLRQLALEISTDERLDRHQRYILHHVEQRLSRESMLDDRDETQKPMLGDHVGEVGLLEKVLQETAKTADIVFVREDDEKGAIIH